jgi:micrococcal nuclease
MRLFGFFFRFRRLRGVPSPRRVVEPARRVLAPEVSDTPCAPTPPCRSRPTETAPNPEPPQQLCLLLTHAAPSKPADRPEQPPAVARPTVLKGKCWVVDGDTIIIKKQHIRIAGIDAPELEHPFGRNSKWAMHALCKGQVITAEVKDELSYGRLVATCYLPDGRDVAAELVKIGLAVDWPKYSGGRYRHLEPPGIRKKLWRCDARQKGRMPPTDYGAARFR